jgi:hypothetical protein
MGFALGKGGSGSIAQIINICADTTVGDGSSFLFYGVIWTATVVNGSSSGDAKSSCSNSSKNDLRMEQLDKLRVSLLISNYFP